MSRVLVTGEAVQQVQRMQSIVNGPLVDQLRALLYAGESLSNADVWDGNLASSYRTEWPEIQHALKHAITETDRLRTQIERIQQNIMTAGGNL